MKKQFINTVDKLGINPTLYMRQIPRDTTLLGACMTIFVGLGSFGIIIYFSATFLSGAGMSVISQLDNINNPISYNLQNKLLMFRFINSEFASVDPRIASLSFLSVRYIAGREIATPYPLEECKFDRHFPKSTYRSLIKNVKLQDFLCVSPEANFTLAFDNFKNSGNYFAILMSKCSNDTGVECYPDEIIDFYLGLDTYYFSFYIENNSLDHYNRSNPFSSIAFSSMTQITPMEAVDFGLFYKAIDYKSDNGLLFADWKSFKGFNFDNSLTTSTFRDSLDSVAFGSFSCFRISLSKVSINIYERDYPKVPSVLADISALVKILFLFGEFVVYLFTTGLYYVSLFNYTKSPLASFQKKPWVSQNQLNSSKQKMTPTINQVQLQKINTFNSAQWMIIPKLTKKTLFIQNCKKMITQLLSVEYIMNKLLVIETLNGTNKQKLPNYLSNLKSKPLSNFAILNTLHDNPTQQLSKNNNTIECLK